MLSVIGGLVMLLGSYFTFKGDIEKSIVTYLFADFIWVFLSFQVGNIFGAFVVFFAMVVGIVVYLKMQKGLFYKTIHKTS